MRPLEILLLCANILTLIVLLVRTPSAKHLLRYVAPSTLLIAVVQGIVEGTRWQLIPAYALSGVLFLIWLRGSISPSKVKLATKKPKNRVFAGLSIAASILISAVSIALPMIFPVFRFPRPSGPYQIGTLTYHWVDTTRPEIFTSNQSDNRELVAQIWYPSKESTSPRIAYMPDADTLTAALARLKNLPDTSLEQLKYVTTNATASAPIANDRPNYPVLIYLEGANGYRQMNTFQVEELVSQGYVVVALDQPYTAASVVFLDGRQATGLTLDQMKPLIRRSYVRDTNAPTLNGQTLEKGIVPYLAQDVIFALGRLTALNIADSNDILTGHLDLERIGTFGVSLGGIVGGEACRIEPRLRACLIMDAPMPTEVVKSGLKQPAMWITRDEETMRLERRRSGGWSESDIREHQSTMRGTFEHSNTESYFVQVPGMFHSNLTDVPYWSPLFPRLGITGPIDKQRAHNLVSDYTVAFFDKHLKLQPAAQLEKQLSQYPEVIFEKRLP